MDNLPELRDIHLPTDGVSVFPLAYGWWVILLLIIAALLLGRFYLWLRRTSARLYAHKLLKPLRQENSVSAAVKMSEILRRVCVRKYPQAVSLVGNEWIEFLNAHSAHPLDEKTAELLKNAPFIPHNSSLYQKEDVQKLWQFCYEWIGVNL